MSRPITAMSPGQLVHLYETESDKLNIVPYIYLGVDASGKVRILRLNASTQRAMNSSNVAHYDGCTADVWLESDTGFLARFDEATRNALVSTSIKCMDENTQDIFEITRRCFLLSYTEYGFGGSNEGASVLEALKIAKNTTNSATAKIATNDSGIAVHAWLRSPYSATQFRFCISNGYVNSNDATRASYCLRPALALSPDTLVSDEGQETIYLLPDPEKAYHEAGITMLLGTRQEMPKKLKVDVTCQNAMEGYPEISVCVNFNDPEPNWIRVESGEVISTKELTAKNGVAFGVKIYARSEGKVKISEPILTCG